MLKRGVLAAICALVLVALVPTAGAYKIPGVCKVPNVSGDTVGAAASALKGAGCSLGSVTVTKSTTVAKGRVISSSPAAGATESGGFSVNLTVSIGSPKPSARCNVPNVKGDTVVAAESALVNADCGVGSIKLKKSKKVAKGRVISSNPAAGATPKAGTKVNLTVSKGKH